MCQKKPLIILTGPTAVGKTALSIELAKAVNGEMISADSMQVYKLLDIGTAKIKQEEMQGIPHHLIDVLDPTEDFNVFLFQKMAKAALEEIYAKGKIPIVVGGTGFYIQALLYDIAFEETTESAYRKEFFFYTICHCLNLITIRSACNNKIICHNRHIRYINDFDIFCFLII